MTKIVKVLTKSGRKIIIADLSKKYIDQFQKYMNKIIDEDTYLHSTQHITKKQILEWLRLQKKGAFIQLIALDNGNIVGEGSLNNNFAERFGGRAELGITVKKEYRNEGIGTAILKELLTRAKKIKNKKYKIRIVFLTVFSNNKNAIRLYKKFGFRKYSYLPKSIYWKGKYVGEIRMFKFIHQFSITYRNIFSYRKQQSILSL
jgi:RimJ/RimL family protein N-acetyltransferase